MQGQKVSTHPSLIRVHVSASQRRRAVDGEPAAIALYRRRAHEAFQRGAGGRVYEGSKCKCTEVATFSYTLVLASVAVPRTKSPPPSTCMQKASTHTFQRGAGARFGKI